VSRGSATARDAIEFLRWCEGRRRRLAQVAELALEAPRSAARESLCRLILVELENCLEMVVSASVLALEQEVGGSPSHVLPPIDMTAIEAVDADIHLQALALSTAAGTA